MTRFISFVTRIPTDLVTIATKSGHSMNEGPSTPSTCVMVDENASTRIEIDSLVALQVGAKDKDLLLIRKFVRRMKGSKRKIVNGQIFEKAANIWP